MRFQTTINHEQSHPVVHLTDHETGCCVEIYALGGMLNAFQIPLGNERINVVDGFASVQDAIENATVAFKSAKLSPYVCRMNRGKYIFANQEYTIEKFFLAGHAIHGLIHDAIFKISSVSANDESAVVNLEYDYKGDDAGYPFPYSIELIWELEKDNHLTATTKITNRHAHAIPMADGWHPYFNLGGMVDDCTLQFNSSTQLEHNADLLPTGNICVDERFVKPISLQGIKLDNSFLFDKNETHPHCILQNKKMMLRIEPDKNYPILQIYIPPHRKSIAIENLSGAPDNFNNKMGLIELDVREQKTFFVSYMVQVKL